MASFGNVTAAQAMWAQQAAAKVSQSSALYRAAAESTGMFEVSQRRLNNATDDYVKKLQKQKATIRDVMRARRGLSQATMKEQLAMQQMVVRRGGTTAGGKGLYDVTIPSTVSKDLDTATNRMRFFREELRSVAQQTVNWGKNVQWAGRQLMVGFTVPVAAFGAAAGVMAYQVDKQLTRIRKVYDTTADANNATQRGQMMVAKELANVTQDAYETATNAAKLYGANITETLEVEADLAATGLKGAELRHATTEVVKNATLGEIQYQDALNATIAMQTVFRLNSQKTSEAWAYMNSVENATSLAMADFAKAIPIAAGPIKRMGGDIRLLGEYLVAMKSAGINATQGANAIKSMLQRLYRPSDKILTQWREIAGLDLTEMVERNKGNIKGMMNEISQATEGLRRQDTNVLFAGLFGTYQVQRIGAITEGMRDLANGVGQVADANAIGEQSAKQWMKVQEYELEQFRRSLSGRFRIAIQTFKAELVPIGTIFLNVATHVVEAGTKIISAFNDLPAIAKKVAIGFAIFTAIIGPIVMLTGLFGNLIGNMAKFAIGVSGLGRRMELLTSDEKAMALATDMANAQFSEGATAAAMYAAQIEKLRQGVVATYAALAVPPTLPGNLFNNRPVGPLANSVNLPFMQLKNASVTGRDAVPISQLSNVQKNVTKQMADDQKEMAKHTGMAAISMAAFAASAGTAMLSTNETTQKMSQIAMMALLIGPALTAAFRGLGAGFSKVGEAIKGASGFTNALKLGFAGLLTPATAVVGALAAAGAAAYLLKRHLDSGKKSVNEMYADAEGLGEILGYSPTEDVITSIDKQGNSVQTLDSKVKKFRETYESVVEKINTAKDDQEKFNYALSQGLKVINTGGTAEQAKEAVKIALTAARGRAEAERLILKFEPRLDFSNFNTLAAQQTSQARMLLEEAFTGAVYASDASLWDTLLLRPTRATNEAEEQAKQAGFNMAAAFSSAFESGTDTKFIENQLDKIMQTFDSRIKQAERAGNGALANQLEKQQAIYLKEIIDRVGTGVDSWGEIRVQLMKGADLYDLMRKYGIQISEQTRKQLKLEREKAAAMKDFIADQRRTQRFMAAGADDTEMLKLHIVNSGGAAKKLADEAERGGKAIKEAATDADKLKSALDKAKEAVPWSEVSDRFKEGIEAVRDDVTQQWQDNFENAMDSHMDGLADDAERQTDRLQRQQEIANRRMDDRQERESRRLDNAWEKRVMRAESRWDARENKIERAYDGRIDGIKTAIELERKAEEQRQRIFDAEVSRLSRLAAMANQQIDFNVALNTGDLDEAAKIRNDMQATQAEWALEDAGERGGRRADARIDRMENRIDRIEDEKDARIDALRDEREEFFRHLKAIEEREKRSLQRRHEREKRMMDDRHKRAQKQLENEIEATREGAEKMWEARRDSLDQAIRYFKSSFIPRTEKGLRGHIQDTKGKYKSLNQDVRGIFDVTAEKVHNSWVREMNAARRDISSEIDWATMGAKIGDRVIQGMWGLNRNQFYKWMVTGEFPGKGKPPSVKDLRDRFQNRRAQNLVDISRKAKLETLRHEGGPIGGGGKDSRKGVARTAKHHPSEVNVLAQKGEYMIQKRSVQKYGEGFMEAINRGKYPVGSDSSMRSSKDPRLGTGGGYGIAGILAGAAAGMAAASAGLATIVGAKQAEAMSQAMFGRFTVGGIPAGFDSEQMKNAAVIANVGRSLGASKRDIMIAFMTALVESGMRNLNYGDRDSIGMFQQRDAWGSRNARLDPRQSARMFFLGGEQGQRGLLDFANRNQMGMGEAAQAVQVSAFPGRYIEMLDEARAIWAALDKSSGAGAGFVAGPGGRHRPVKGGVLTQGIHGSPPAVDIGVPVGSALYAVGSGKIVQSRDLRGYESRLPANAQNGYYSYGRYIIQSLDGGGRVLYAHLNDRFVSAGQRVSGGSLIGKTGNTGWSKGPHLHFGASPMSPFTFLAKGGVVGQEGKAYIHGGEAVVSPDRTAALYASLDTFERVMAQLEANSGRMLTINPTTGEPGVLRAGAYNLLNSTKNARSKKDLEKLMARADVLGLTEFIGKKRNIRNWLEDKGWGVVGPHGPGGDSAMAFNRMKYELLRSGGAPLNTTTTSRGGGRTRYASYGLLRDKKTGNEFWNIVAHAVNKKGGGDKYLKIQQEQFKALQELAKNLGTGGQPVFIMGDLNTLKPNVKGFTPRTGRGIDHILAQAGIRTTGSSQIRGLSSDHPAVLAQFAFPALAKGASNINVEGLYKLHRNEGVLTEDINKQFKEGVRNFANGGGNTYNIDMNFNGDVSDKASMRRFIIQTMRDADKRLPTNRKGSD